MHGKRMTVRDERRCDAMGPAPFWSLRLAVDSSFVLCAAKGNPRRA